MTKPLDPALKYQRAEERACECGAAGSGEGHSDWCPWLRIAETTERHIFGKLINAKDRK